MDNTYYVIKRKGIKEPMDFNKIQRRIGYLVNEPYKLHNINVIQLTQAVVQGLVDGINTVEIDLHTANLAASMSIKHRDYLILAGRVAINNHHKNTLSSFKDKINLLYLRKDKNGKICSLINDNFYKYVEKNQMAIDKYIDYSRDYAYDFFGFKTLEKGYLLEIDGKCIERPQDLLMRVAIQIHMPLEESEYRNEYYLKKIFHMYDMMSMRYYTHATPTLFNSGTNKGNYSSCFLLGSFDSLEGIMKTLSDSVQISKWSGGIGVHISSWRAEGSLIRGTNGKSNGIVPFLRMYNDGARAFNQGGRRNGSFAVYLEPHHPDILKFLELRSPHGDENLRCRDLYLALWISDLFMKRVQNNELWSTFCPDVCPGLNDVYGEEYEKLYLEYEEKKMWSSQIPARTVWKSIFKCQKESGMPYMLYKDVINERSMQKNIGVVKSSNLCVSGDTLILTDKGYFPIKELTENEPTHKVWNGKEFTDATFAKTGENQELLEIKTSHGNIIKCTSYHKFILTDGARHQKEKIIEAKELKIGDSLVKFEFKKIESNVEDFRYAYTHGFFCADGTYEKHPLKDNVCNNPSVLGTNLCQKHMNMYKQGGSNTEKCTATGIKIPRLSLYSENKKKLLEYFDLNPNQTVHEYSNKTTIYLVTDLQEKFEVPINYSFKSKLEWLAGLLDGDGCLAKNGKNLSLQLCSINKEFLYKIRLLCNTLGIDPIISEQRAERKQLLPDGKGGNKEYDCKTQYRILFNSYDTCKLYELGLPCKRLVYNGHIPNRNAKSFNKIISIKKLEEKDDTYCFNEPKLHRGIFNGILLGNCAEITLVSSTEEYSVCNLSSICLPSFVEDTYTKDELLVSEYERRPLNHEFPINPKFNYKKLAEIAADITENLNNVIDKNWNPVLETARSNFRNRPIGIGIQGLADVFLKFRIPFESEEAKKLNKNISEAIYYGALSKSTELCRTIYQKINRTIDSHEVYKKNVKIEVYTNGIYKHTLYTKDVLKQYPQLEEENLLGEYTKETLPKDIGSYPTYKKDGGSPLYNGKFHWELYGLDKEQLSGMFDWETLREHIKIYGVRNSMTTAYMPTASTSQIMGNSICFEPYMSNIYTRTTLAGTFPVINKYLMKDLQDLGLWNEDMKSYLLVTNGSVQNIEGIPPEIKELYKTGWEIKQKNIMDLAIDRQPFIDQSQSMNLHMEVFDLDKFTSMQFYAWKNKLKTGSYYVRTREAVSAQKFTVSHDMQKQIEFGRANVNIDQEEETCLLCSS